MIFELQETVKKPLSGQVHPIVGTWKLLACYYQTSKGETVDYYGPNPIGILMYDTNGLMNAQLMNRGRPNFASDAVGSGSLEEIRDAFNTYQAYFGRYREETPGTVIHTVEGSVFPNWFGHEEIRHYTIIDNRLSIFTPPIEVNDSTFIFYVEWERIEGPSFTF
jgi:hypothetical protein